MSNVLLPPTVNQLIDIAIEEDLGRGDVTTRLTIPPQATTTGRAVAREEIVMSGGDVFEAVMHRVDPSLEVKLMVEPGVKVKTGDVIIEVTGAISSLLMAERVSLNFLQRLCAVATLTRKFVDRVPEDSKTRITDTRKTSPGMRFLERRAVLDGGGHNHRLDLSGGILIKENHVAGAGSITAAVTRCRQGAPHPLRVEIEVRSEEELKEALAAKADMVLLDNMTPQQIEACLKINNSRAFVEASGGINLDTVTDIAATGVDAISVGALTHSAPAADISFLFEGV